MILGGDEISRTQNGNNNAYCQDNETTWVDWRLDGCKIVAAGIHAEADSVPARSSQPASPEVLSGPRDSRY